MDRILDDVKGHIIETLGKTEINSLDCVKYKDASKAADAWLRKNGVGYTHKKVFEFFKERGMIAANNGDRTSYYYKGSNPKDKDYCTSFLAFVKEKN